MVRLSEILKPSFSNIKYSTHCRYESMILYDVSIRIKYGLPGPEVSRERFRDFFSKKGKEIFSIYY